jgi:hypothetical protein
MCENYRFLEVTIVLNYGSSALRLPQSGNHLSHLALFNAFAKCLVVDYPPGSSV